ncbi:glycosyltransferase family protein [Undibacterium griseum]|uniref:Glycosyltransferase family 2 protein n=1 Tax=Undibacterium griseum TaxID=2762295 RepID=A0ABR6YK81_9BURK|nr:glycosyltransferase family 2 protein [Undibacterium griseum]MBC3884279.1 glycosyltransferase family 2 protein [Undibacterium griseum]
MIHVAIISHGHEDLLISSQLGGLLDAQDDLHLWIKDNQPSARLKAYCLQHGISYTNASPGLGFGANNNFLFRQIQNSVGLKVKDVFVVMNPDIAIEPAVLRQLVHDMQQDAFPLATLNLYKDHEFTTPDANVRLFPDWLSPLRMAIVKSLTQPYDKSRLPATTHVDWASGAFLAFDAAHYEQLQGFDDRYFMYFEDVDICYRSYLKLGKGVRYYPHLKAVHFAAHKNRSVLSPHANWFIRSFLKFLSRKYFVYSRPVPGSY